MEINFIQDLCVYDKRVVDIYLAQTKFIQRCPYSNRATTVNQLTSIH